MSDEKHPINVKLTANALGSYIEVDGVRIPYVTAVSIEAKVGEATKIKLEVLALDGVKIVGEVGDVVKQTVDGAITIR